MKLLLIVLGAAAAGYVAVSLYLALFQARMVFAPTRQVEADPSDVGLEFSDVRFSAEDGILLHGWYIPHPKARGTVLFNHGNAGNIGMRLESVRFFHSLGLSSLIYDYRGYGRSEGTPSEEGLMRDARAAWAYLAEQGEPAERIVLWGRSLGNAVAVLSAEDLYRTGAGRPAGLIAESGFTSIPDVGALYYPWFPVRLLARIRFNALKAMPSVGCPLLYVHSPEDEVVPYELGCRLYAAALEPKKRVDIRGSHNSGWRESMDVYEPAVRGFLDRVLPPVE